MVLAIETATEVCAAAVVNNAHVLSERLLRLPHIHSVKLMTLVDEVLKESKTDARSLNCITISIGPGSFTGLRIGLSAAKGLAYAWNKPLVAVPTLEALAWNVVQHSLAQQDEIILSLIDARRNEVYAGCYRYTNNALQEIFPIRAMTLDELCAIEMQAQRITVLGDGAKKFRGFLETQQSAQAQRFRFVADEQSRCTASSVGIIGGQKMLRNELADVATIEPLYVKEFQTITTTQQQTTH